MLLPGRPIAWLSRPACGSAKPALTAPGLSLGHHRGVHLSRLEQTSAAIELTLRDCDTLGLMLQCCVLRMPTEICVLYVLQSTQQSALELRTGSSAARLSGLDAGTDRATIEDRQRHPGPK